jgi:hypothetical protein
MPGLLSRSSGDSAFGLIGHVRIPADMSQPDAVDLIRRTCIWITLIMVGRIFGR